MTSSEPPSQRRLSQRSTIAAHRVPAEGVAGDQRTGAPLAAGGLQPAPHHTANSEQCAPSGRPGFRQATSLRRSDAEVPAAPGRSNERARGWLEDRQGGHGTKPNHGSRRPRSASRLKLSRPCSSGRVTRPNRNCQLAEPLGEGRPRRRTEPFHQSECLPVVGLDARREAFDSCRRRKVRQAAEHSRRQSLALPIVGDDDRKIGRVGSTPPGVARDADDFAIDDCDHRLPVVVVDVEQPLG